MGPPDIKKMIQIKIKPRKDPMTDQYSRIFMVKMMMLTATITGISWAKDKFTCIVPKSHDVSGGFVARSCWINGVYIYENLNPNFEGLYYGIPKDISHDGVNRFGSQCDTKSDAGCEPLEKTFYLQYQWFPLGITLLAFMYYLPYLLYCVVNADLISLKDRVKQKKKEDVDYEELITKYFTPKNNPNSNARSLLNILVKVLYIVVNVLGLIIIDSIMNGGFKNYGQKWADWLKLTPNQRHDYTVPRSPKAGHELLPGFGLCQVASAGQDIKNKVINKHVFICEISQHVLYQYILIILWYVMILGIILSVIGFILHVVSEFSSAFRIGSDSYDMTRLFRYLTIRERQLLGFIFKKNMPVFGELVDKLMKHKKVKPEDESYSSDFDRKCTEKERMIAEEVY